MKKLLRRPVVYNIVSILLFAIVMVMLYFVSRNTLIEKQTHILTLNRDVNVAEIESEFLRIESVLYDIHAYVLNHEDQTEILNYITEVSKNYAMISSVYLGTPDNTMIITSNITFPPGWDLTTRPWYIDAIEENGITFTDAFLDVSLTKYIITGTMPVYKDGTLIGVIGIDINLATISNYIYEYIPNVDGYSFLIDGADNLLAYRDLDLADLNLVSAESYSIPVDQLRNGNGITDTIRINNEDGKIAYAKIGDTDFIYGVYIPLNELNQTLRSFFIIAIAFLAAIILAGVSIYVIFFNFIQKPTHDLIYEIDQINLHDSYAYRLDTDKKSYFIKARLALNKILNDTQNYKKQAIDNLTELTLRNQKYNLLLESASDIVFQVDVNQRYIEVYGEGLKTLKMKETDFIGKTYGELFGESLNEKRDQSLYLVLDGRKSVYSWEFVIDKKVIYFETAMSPLFDVDNQIIGVVGVTRDITEQEMRYQDMVNISTHDYLTGLRNRRFYIEHLRILDTMQEYPFGVMNIDVNGLKIINDAYGHSIGDEALIKTANVLKSISKSEYIVSRVSGDEFTIILPNSGEIETKELKDKLLKAFQEVKISNLNLSVAIGYCIKEDNTKDIEEVRMLAENDMFRHKISERKSVKNKAISAILKTLTEKYEDEKVHSKIVAELSTELGKALELSDDDLRDLSTAAMFHDIGKISIPDNIIRKPGKLTEREYEIMKSHTEVGYEILRAADEYSELAIYASSHHERWDGLGYPRGLKGEKIPLFSRIISIADSFEAMTADRPYREKQSLEYAASEIIKYAGTQFDPKLAKIFVEKVLKRPWTK